MTVTEERTSPLFLPSCLCSVPGFSPGAHLPLQPCRHTHTQDTQDQRSKTGTQENAICTSTTYDPYSVWTASESLRLLKYSQAPNKTPKRTRRQGEWGWLQTLAFKPSLNHALGPGGLILALAIPQCLAAGGLTLSPGRPGLGPARHVCWPVWPTHPAAAALGAFVPPSSASLEDGDGTSENVRGKSSGWSLITS